MGKLVSYIRLSKEDEFVKDESNSISNQRELIRKYIRKSPELMKMEQIELKDDGYSGKNMERPAMQELLSMIKKGKVSCIIVKDISRFSRDYIETGKYMEQIFPFLEIRFISINDNYDSAECTGGIAEVGAKHPVAQSEEDWKKIENHHEAIISEEMFDTVKKKRAGNRNTSQVRESHCLKGKIICGNCGHKMTHSNAGRPKYECRQHYVNHSITGCVKSVRDEDIEVIVIQELQTQLDAMLDNERVQKRQQQLQSEKLHEAEKKLRTMQLSQEKIEADLQNAYEAYKSGLTDKETYLEQRRVYEQLEERMRETVQKQMKIVSEYEEKVLTMPVGFDIIESRTKVVELNREIVEIFVDRIVVHEGGEIEIGWKFGNKIIKK